MNISDRATAKQLIDALTSTTARAPKPVVAAYARATRITKAAGNLAAPPDARFAAVTAALEDGRDPAADPEVQRLVVASVIANEATDAAVAALSYDRFREVCTEHADGLVGAWRRPFNDAAATLASCHQRIGTVPLTDTNTIMRLGGDAAAVWASAQEAAGIVDTVLAGWGALGEFVRRLRQPDRADPCLRLSDLDLGTLQRGQFEGRKVAPWELVCAGVALSLPTFDEYKARVAGVEAARAEVREKAAQQAHDIGVGRIIVGRRGHG